VDVGRERVEFVERPGADYAVDAGDAEKLVREKLGGVYASLVFAPRVRAYELGLKILRPLGALVVVGAPAEAEGPIPLTPIASLVYGVRVIPTIVGVRHEFEELFKLAVEGKVRSYISKSIGLNPAEVMALFEDLEKGRYLGRAVIRIS